VYPGDFERGGLSPNYAGTSYDALAGAETQYMIGGARVVWSANTHAGSESDREERVTIGMVRSRDQPASGAASLITARAIAR